LELLCQLYAHISSSCGLEKFKRLIFVVWRVYHKFVFELIFLAAVKLLLLCDLFTKRKTELSHEERHEIIRYAKSRLPIFMSQLHRFLQGVKSTFSSMSPSQRQEVATYLVPEVSSKYT